MGTPGRIGQIRCTGWCSNGGNAVRDKKGSLRKNSFRKELMWLDQWARNAVGFLSELKGAMCVEKRLKGYVTVLKTDDNESFTGSVSSQNRNAREQQE